MKTRLLSILAFVGLTLSANAQLYEVVTIYGPPEGAGFYHVCGPGDVNGDGYDDFIISSPARDRSVGECENGYARLYFGSNPIDTSNYITIPPVCNEDQFSRYGFGKYCEKIGDINGDDYPDFLIGDPDYDSSYWGPWANGAGFIYWGGEIIDTLPGLRLIGNTYNATSKFRGYGDVNGDGYNDIVSSVAWRDYIGPVNIYLGGESPDSIPDFQIDPLINGYPVIADPAKIIGDYNGDGYDDIVFSNHMFEWDSTLGQAYMFFGSENGFNEPDLIFDVYMEFIPESGDINGDEIGDIIITDEDKVSIYYGSQTPDTTADIVILGEYVGYGNFLSVGDLNQDNHLDIAVSDSWWYGQYIQQGRILIFYGATEIDTIPDIVIEGEDEYQRFGTETAFPGDINGNGSPEFIASSQYLEDPGRACVTIYTTDMNSAPDNGQTPSDYDIKVHTYPNPFNSNTTLTINNPRGGDIEVVIYNLYGQEVKRFQAHGGKEVKIGWDATDAMGNELSTGIYFARARTSHQSQIIKLIHLK